MTMEKKKPVSKKQDLPIVNQRKQHETALALLYQHLYNTNPKLSIDNIKQLFNNHTVKNAILDVRALHLKRQTIVSAIRDLSIVMGTENSTDHATEAYLLHLEELIRKHTLYLHSVVLNAFRLHKLGFDAPTIIMCCPNQSESWSTATILPSLNDVMNFVNKREDDTWYNRLDDAFIQHLTSNTGINVFPHVVMGYSVVGMHVSIIIERGIVLHSKDVQFQETIHNMMFKGIDIRWLKDLRDCVSPNRFCHNVTRFDLPALFKCIPLENQIIANSHDLFLAIRQPFISKLKCVLNGDVSHESQECNVLIENLSGFKLMDTDMQTTHVIGMCNEHILCEDISQYSQFKAYSLIVQIDNVPPLYVRYCAKKTKYFEGLWTLNQFIVDAIYRLVRASRGSEPFTTHAFPGVATSQSTIAEGIFIDHIPFPSAEISTI